MFPGTKRVSLHNDEKICKPGNVFGGRLLSCMEMRLKLHRFRRKHRALSTENIINKKQRMVKHKVENVMRRPDSFSKYRFLDVSTA